VAGSAFPGGFESGYGCTLTDVDGNTFLDFSSGIYVTTLGHCHPKVTEAVQKAAGQLMNCHDFTTPVKVRLLEKMSEIIPGNLSGIQLYDSGTTASRQGCECAGLRPESTSSSRVSGISTANRDILSVLLG